MKKRVMVSVISLAVAASAAGCSLNSESLESDSDVFKVAMVTDTGGINDQSFNSSSWEGMSEFARRTGAKARYVESTQASDYTVNIDRLADENCNLIWGIGFSLADIVNQAAKTNPELNYAIVDFSYGDDTLENVTGVVFRSEESSFMVGYIAARTTKTNSVGFVGGISGVVIDQFEYGYRAGVDYASKELGKQINVKIQYAESFSDSAKGKAIALKMFSEGCDIVFHAAGGVGVGIIEAAKESGNFAIGVDLDQSYLAPSNVLTSSLKDVGRAVDIVSTKVLKGQSIGGRTLSFGLSEDCVGIPKENPNMSPEVYKSAMEIRNKIVNKDIIPPYNSDTYKNYREKLGK